jgi:hypothetical protein
MAGKQLDMDYLHIIGAVLKCATEMLGKGMTQEQAMKKAVEKVRAEDPYGKNYTPEQIEKGAKTLATAGAMMSSF